MNYGPKARNNYREPDYASDYAAEAEKVYQNSAPCVLCGRMVRLDGAMKTPQGWTHQECPAVKSE